jgi:hypothetical protein
MSAPVDGMTGDARAAVDKLLFLRGQPIVLIPATGTVIEKPGGGKDYGPGVPRASQMFAKFNKQALDGVENAQTDRGTTRKFQFEMIGAFDAVVEVGDSWEDFAAKYTVESVDITQPYQVKAIVIAFLKLPGHGFGG